MIEKATAGLANYSLTPLQLFTIGMQTAAQPVSYAASGTYFYEGEA
ncbi:hypothetical protein [Paenibacillus turpanensis]|nr:hypothetical protein [Paenibacillus turpanensis]